MKPETQKGTKYFLKKNASSFKFQASGFTLVEMLVSLAVFAVVIVLNLAIVFSISNAQKKAIALQNAEDNVRFAFESMAKEIRTGRSFHCDFSNPSSISSLPQNCPSGGVSFTFINAPAGDTVTYQILGNQLVKSSDSNVPCTLPSANNCQRITAISVEITRLTFIATGTGSGDGAQPKVTVIIQGQVKDKRGIGTATLNLQTTISQAKLDS